MFSSKFCRPTLVVPFLPKSLHYYASFANRLWSLRFCQNLSCQTFPACFGLFFVKHPTQRLQTKSFYPCLPTHFGGYVLDKVFPLSCEFCRPTLVVSFLAKFVCLFLDFFRQASNPASGNKKQKVVSSKFCRPTLVFPLLPKYLHYHASFADRLWLFRFAKQFSKPFYLGCHVKSSLTFHSER